MRGCSDAGETLTIFAPATAEELASRVRAFEEEGWEVDVAVIHTPVHETEAGTATGPPWVRLTGWRPQHPPGGLGALGPGEPQ